MLISIVAILRGGHDAASLKSIREYHQMILDALAKQDSAVAMCALSKHLQASREERLVEYDMWKRESSLRDNMPGFFDIHKMGNHG